MKLNKIFAIALAALTMTACSDDDEDFNTASGVSVQMQSASLETRENTKIFNVPIEVVGKANGPIVVYVETTPTGSEPAVADENYLVTSERIIIPAGETVGYVEICPVDDNDENETRTFNVTITKVEGANIGAQKTTTVGLRDNDQDPYEKMTGKWTMYASTVFNNGDDGPFTLTVDTPDPDDEDEADYYGYELYGYGLIGMNEVYVTLNYNYNEITNEVTMSIQTGSPASTVYFNFGSFNGVFFGSSQYPANGFNFGSDIPLTYGVDEAKGVEYYEADPNAMFFLSVITYPNFDQNMGYYDGWDGIRFERPLAK